MSQAEGALAGIGVSIYPALSVRFKSLKASMRLNIKTALQGVRVSFNNFSRGFVLLSLSLSRVD